MAKRQIHNDPKTTSNAKDRRALNSDSEFVRVIPILQEYRWLSGILGLMFSAFAGFLFIRYFRMSTSSTIALVMTLLAAVWAMHTFRSTSSLSKANRQRRFIPLLVFFMIVPLSMYKLYLYSNRDLSVLGEMIFTAFLGSWLLGSALRRPVLTSDQNQSQTPNKGLKQYQKKDTP
jgi:hypothetical protein